MAGEEGKRTQPSNMRELRVRIDEIDRALVELVAQRVACIDRAVEIKRSEGLPARIEDRVDEVLANVRRLSNARGLDVELTEQLWRDLVEWSIAHEEKKLGKGQQ